MPEGSRAQRAPSASKPPPWSQALRALRETRGVTREGWAARLSYGRSTVQRWERGEAVPDADAERAILALCRELGLFRSYDHGPLRGITVTPEWLSDLLAEARLGGASVRPPAVPDPSRSQPPAPRVTIPTGTATLLFTSISGGRGGDDPASAVWDIVRQAALSCGGAELEAAEDLLIVAFTRAAQALTAAVTAQRVLGAQHWPEGGSGSARMGLHAGRLAGERATLPTELRQRGEAVHCAAHGGQIVLSAAAAALAREALPPDMTLVDLGEHRLFDSPRPERLFQVRADSLPADFPPPRTLATAPNNLPIPATPLIGREAARAAVRALCRRNGARLITLTGAGGTGKTRLAVHVAAELLHDFRDGAFLVQLAAVTDPRLVLSAIASALNVREEEGRRPDETLRDYLRERELLLVLDNFEQILDAAPQVADLLAACPRVTALITSRAPLRLSGEQTLAVPPLEMTSQGPRPALRVRASSRSLESGTHLPPAVELFVERARAARVDFALTEANAGAVAEVCARLDGLPLAIELAAARTRLMSVHELLERLRGGDGGMALGLLAGGPRDLPARQQTMHNAITWSYDLLAEQERVLFRRLSAFVGGFTLDAAEEVAGDRNEGTGTLFLDLLGALVDHSLVRVEERGERVRYWMLEPIREYAAERLDASGERGTLAARHLAWCLALVEQTMPDRAGPEQNAWFARLEEEHDNLRVAFDRALASGAVTEALRVAAALGPFWYDRGHITEGLERLTRALEAAPNAEPLLRARALAQAGWLAWAKAQYARAGAWLERALEVYRAAGDARGIASTLLLLGRLTMLRGEPERTLALLEEALARYRALDDQPGIAEALLRLGAAACWQGDLDRAETCCIESLALYHRLGDKLSTFSPLNVLARVAELRRNFAQARRLGEDALALARASGNTRWLADALQDLGRLLNRVGDHALALSYQRESLIHYRTMGLTGAVGFSLNSLAHTLAAMGDYVRAARLLGASEALRDAAGFEIVPIFRRSEERLQALLQTALGPDAAASARLAGRHMTLDMAINEALHQDDDSSATR